MNISLEKTKKNLRCKTLNNDVYDKKQLRLCKKYPASVFSCFYLNIDLIILSLCHRISSFFSSNRFRQSKPRTQTHSHARKLVFPVEFAPLELEFRVP